eukprot:Lankesteria_metandrocarpae@DN5448_c0_g1_i4.p1
MHILSVFGLLFVEITFQNCLCVIHKSHGGNTEEGALPHDLGVIETESLFYFQRASQYPLQLDDQFCRGDLLYGDDHQPIGFLNELLGVTKQGPYTESIQPNAEVPVVSQLVQQDYQPNSEILNSYPVYPPSYQHSEQNSGVPLVSQLNQQVCQPSAESMDGIFNIHPSTRSPSQRRPESPCQDSSFPIRSKIRHHTALNHPARSPS